MKGRDVVTWFKANPYVASHAGAFLLGALLGALVF